MKNGLTYPHKDLDFKSECLLNIHEIMMLFCVSLYADPHIS